MSKRRNVEDVVWVDDGEGARFLARIDARAADRADKCTRAITDATHDQDCVSWPNVEFMDEAGKPTGDYCYHVSECEMHDTPQ